MVPNGTQGSTMVTNGNQWYQVVPNGTKLYLMVPNGTIHLMFSYHCLVNYWAKSNKLNLANRNISMAWELTHLVVPRTCFSKKKELMKKISEPTPPTHLNGIFHYFVFGTLINVFSFILSFPVGFSSNSN